MIKRRLCEERKRRGERYIAGGCFFRRNQIRALLSRGSVRINSDVKTNAGHLRFPRSSHTHVLYAERLRELKSVGLSMNETYFARLMFVCRRCCCFFVSTVSQTNLFFFLQATNFTCFRSLPTFKAEKTKNKTCLHPNFNTKTCTHLGNSDSSAAPQ